MTSNRDVTVVTDRGQVSIPARVRHELGLRSGRRLLWQRVGDREMRVLVLDEAPSRGAEAMRGFARRFRAERRSTKAWMRALREGEHP